MKTVESGAPAVFPLVQTVNGYEYMPDTGKITVRDRAGSIVHEYEIAEGDTAITLPEVETGSVDYRWVRMTFTSGGQVMVSKWSYRIIPFLGTTVSNDQVRTRLGVSEEMLPDSLIDLTDQYLNHQNRYTELQASEDFDRLVVLAECVRLAKISAQWMLKSRKLEDLSETRYDHDLDALLSDLSQEYTELLVKLVPSTEQNYSPPQLLQFVTMTDVITGA